MGIMECLILIVVVGLTFGAIFSTMAWATKSYVFSKQDKESRELLFSWIQTFESLWPGDYDVDPDVDYPPGEVPGLDDAAEVASNILGGTWVGGETREARIGGFTLTAVDSGTSGGRLELRVAIQTGDTKKTLVDLRRNYNAFSNDTVSDDKVKSVKSGS
jgi:hypothetical protein